MLEVTNINAVQKGSLLATCDVHVKPWRMTFHDIKVFEKGSNRWITLPAKELVNDMGEKKYIEMISFDNEGVKNRFRSQIMGAIDKYLSTNPDMKPEDAIREDEELPF